MGEMVKKVLEVAHHRNGVGGEGFHVVRFTATDPAAPGEMVGVVFGALDTDGDAPAKPLTMRVAVLCVPELMDGNIAFACGNSWRGDQYAYELVEAIAAYERGRRAEAAR